MINKTKNSNNVDKKHFARKHNFIFALYKSSSNKKKENVECKLILSCLFLFIILPLLLWPQRKGTPQSASLQRGRRRQRGRQRASLQRGRQREERRRSSSSARVRLLREDVWLKNQASFCLFFIRRWSEWSQVVKFVTGHRSQDLSQVTSHRTYTGLTITFSLILND